MTSPSSKERSRVSAQVTEAYALPDLECDPHRVRDAVNPGDEDADTAFDFPRWRKWLIVIAVSLMYTNSYLATTSIVPAAPQVVHDFQVDSSLYRTLLVSIWELGEGVGPFLIAPLSERYGRLPVFHIGNVLGILCSVAGALSVNISMLIAFRFLNGGVLTALTLGPAIIADMFRPEERGMAMAVGTGLNLIGLFIGPIAGGLITEARGWRWTLWLNTITMGTVALFAAVVMRETYAVKLSAVRTARTRTGAGDGHPGNKPDVRTGVIGLIHSLTTPMRMLCRSPLVLLISLYTAFAYGMVYTVLTTLAPSLEEIYGFSQGVVGVAFLAISIGEALAMLFYGLTSDRYMRRRRASEGTLEPERRLVHMVLGAVTLPCGIFLWGWTMDSHVQFMAPLIGVSIIGFSMMLSMLPTQTYLADVFKKHSASAIAAGVILRAFFGALFPLCGPPLFDRLGLGWGNSVLGFVAIAFIPGVVLLRTSSRKLRKAGPERYD